MATLPGKPRLRGVLHQWAAAVALGAGLVVVAMAPGAQQRLAAGVFALALLLAFGISAAYHRPQWRPRARAFMRRLDHAAIFVLIAGTYTPVCLLALGPTGRWLLVGIWIGAAAGIVMAIRFPRAPRPLAALPYLLLGWAIVPYLPDATRALGGGQLALLAVGGVLYTAGALVYALRRPRLAPAIFGYHELFHALTIAAAAAHFALVISLAAG